MKIISFITGEDIIYKILDHIGLWAKKPSRDPPSNGYFTGESVVREPFDDDWPTYDELCVKLN